MATIKLHLSSKKNTITDENEIKIRFCGGRDYVSRAGSGIFINSLKWDAKNGRIIMPRDNRNDIREREDKQRKLEMLQRHIVDDFRELDKDEFHDKWLQETVDSYHHPRVTIDTEDTYISDLFDLYHSDAKIGVTRKMWNT